MFINLRAPNVPKLVGPECLVNSLVNVYKPGGPTLAAPRRSPAASENPPFPLPASQDWERRVHVHRHCKHISLQFLLQILGEAEYILPLIVG